MKTYGILEEKLQEEGRSLDWLARQLGISRQALHSWRKSGLKVRMTEEQRATLERVTGLSMEKLRA